MLAAPRQSPALLHIIQKITDNVDHRTYKEKCGGHADLCITGPGAYTEALREAKIEPHAVCLYREPNLLVGDKIIARINERDHKAMKKCRVDCNNYSDLYKKNQVYCSEPGGDPPANYPVARQIDRTAM
eukprot:gnl/TRDRNA2_/TRDRNA2_169923_c0_seq2.p1 gnl/TRDRNA2_/TRDRNA2_169923_c0~~gnl/TRDRNA2_/TRDRNA2_169923_c0_seq2.p1  ORF type:complete len:129 (+),score=18.96 gnl/TRDRNA2_/TRDRNA2_169923_c0_seq2:315-701(+)